MRFYLKTNDVDERAVFITGNFNLWNPRNSNFQLNGNSNKEYFIEIDDDLLPDKIEYKFTKGGWQSVEIDQYGSVTPNRKIEKSKKEVTDFVEKWRFNWGPFKDEYSPKIELISENFFIPQLNRTRKVWALLPYNYEASTKSYPVLYLQDAQNLFNEGSEYGNWEIDKKLSILSEYGRGDVIIIAVEHGDEDRMREYIFDNEMVVKNAEGKKYIRFVTDTLKPYVDANFRTKPEREFTGIGGSSLGALISLYGGFLYPEVYSKLMLFSPSLWVEPQYNFPMLNFNHPFPIKVYVYGGELEGSKMTQRIRVFERIINQLDAKKSINFEFKTSINPEGKHQEFYWSQEFPRAVEWLYYDSKEDPLEIMKKENEKANK